MKGLSTALTIVVTVIVLLIIAVVIVTIFGSAILPVSGLAEARNNCKLQAEASCSATGQLPATWTVPTQRYERQLNSCSGIFGTICDCAPGDGFGCQ